MKTAWGVTLGAFLMLVGAQPAHAENVSWSHSYTSNVYSVPGIAGSIGGNTFFKNPVVTVQYRAHMENADTGAIIPSGSTVPVGTRVKLVFDDHTYQDISWFASGASYDSPYGDWRSDAVAPPIACNAKDFVGADTRKSNQGDVYASLAVNPPAETLSGIDGMDCAAPASDGSRICTVSAGTYAPVFTFGSDFPIDVPTYDKKTLVAPTHKAVSGTYGYFYVRFKDKKSGECIGTEIPSTGAHYKEARGTGPAFVVEVPVLTIPMSLTVSADDTNVDSGEGAPESPALAAVGSAACSAGTPYTISMSATDPQGDQIRYGIDWNGDGSVDQFVPAIGYVLSGTSQTASRTFSSAGAKTVRVLAEDAGGHDSAFASLSFDCVSDDARGNADGFSGNGMRSAGTGLGGESGSLAPDLQIRAIPSLVRAGNTSLINWSASGVVSCTVSGSDGEAWAGIQSPVGGERSVPIMRQTTFTLSCRTALGTTITKVASVSILPSWLEI